jgi:NAD(P)-dependent dehydrogenase (short-subunit alcohol dehydrogenase family)
MLLKDRVALITGAGRGLGQAVAVAYTRQGARVIATARSADELARTADQMRAVQSRALGGEDELIQTIVVDVADEAAMSAMASAVLDRYGRLDVLVNNAGQLIVKSFDEMSLAEWDNIIRVNLRGAVLGCKLFLGAMTAQGGGSIINVSSNAGVMGFPLESAYCASKFALEGFSRALALELQPNNIAVNTITPGKLPGGMTIKPTSLTQAEFDALSPAEQARWADPAILTEAFIFLALQRGHGATGQRVPAFELSEQIRREGWTTTYRPFPS